MDHKKAALFVLFVVLFSFFYVIVNAELTGQVTRLDPSIAVTSASCLWKDDHFEICSTMSWDAEQTYYAQGYVAGGEPLTKAPKLFQSPAVYCQNVGAVEGKHAVHAYLYSTRGSLKSLSTDRVVDCSLQVESTSQESPKKFVISAEGEFRRRPKGEGSVRIDGFSGTPVACSVVGTFVTDDTRHEGQTETCNRASGSFSGVYNHGLQKVTVDANPFAWQGIAGLFSDPDPISYQGYVGYMTFCDRKDYTSGRYYARFQVTDIDATGLTLSWDYFNDQNTKVEFLGEVQCDTLRESAPVIESPVVVEPVVEEEPEELIIAPVIDEEESVGSPIPSSSYWSGVWSKVKGWFS
ncbi:MAG: hypothetical protein Q7R96_04055 [Nanoarchaeota archaeon]|nr:hypothetical protein [Nanoarchaeota archaeon]